MKNQVFNLIYLAAWVAMLPVILWRRIFNHRPLGNPIQRVLGLVPRIPDSKAVIWLHAVSVGEVNQLESLVEQLRHQRPKWPIVISTTTATGMQLARKKFPELTIFWFPIDFSWAIRNVIRRIRPALLVLTELELWPNLIDITCKANIPVAVINGRLGEKSFQGYQRFSRITRPMFSRLTMVVTQDDGNAGRFVRLGTDKRHVHVVGSLKYDNAVRQARQFDDGQLQHETRTKYSLNPENMLWVAGSTQESEEAMVGEIYLSLVSRHPQLRLVIAPRHPHRANEIARQLEQSGLRVVRRTSGESISGDSPRDQPAPVLLIDTIGELGLWWSLATIAFVGGSFGPRGGQNMLEPAAAGCATCFGPNTWNFEQIVTDMVTSRAGRQVASCQELQQFVQRCLTDPEFARAFGCDACKFVDRRQGATNRTVELIASLLPERKSVPRRNPAAA